MPEGTPTPDAPLRLSPAEREAVMAIYQAIAAYCHGLHDRGTPTIRIVGALALALDRYGAQLVLDSTRRHQAKGAAEAQEAMRGMTDAINQTVTETLTLAPWAAKSGYN